MRKMNPGDVKTDFIDGLATLSTFYGTTRTALRLASQKSFLAENALLAAAVMWEGFVSDLLLAYINRDTTRFATHLEDALPQELSEKQKTILTKCGKLTIPQHLKKADIQELIDGGGNNITFSNFAALVDQTKSWLVKADADRFAAANARQRAVVNALIAVRNDLAHRSERSHRAMNLALNEGALHPTGLRRVQNNVNYIGAYLKARVTQQNRERIEVFLTELQAVAAAL